MILLYETETFALSYDPTYHWLYSQWTGINPASLAKTECELILSYVQHYKCTKLFNDGQADKDGWGSLTTWVAESFIKDLAQAGVVAIAWVQPTDTYALHSAHKVVQQLAGLEFRKPLLDIFTDLESVYAWLARWPEDGKKSN